jgi:hypothetical protein
MPESKLTPNWIMTPVARACVREDGIVYVEITPGCEQTPESARHNLNSAFKLCGGIKRPIIVDLRGAVPLDRATRQVYTGQDIAENFTGLAIMTMSDPVNRLMANVYLNVARLPIPTRTFSDIERAVVWLKSL